MTIEKIIDIIVSKPKYKILYNVHSINIDLNYQPKIKMLNYEYTMISYRNLPIWVKKIPGVNFDKCWFEYMVKK